MKNFYKLMTLDEAFDQYTFAYVKTGKRLMNFGQYCQALMHRGWRII